MLKQLILTMLVATIAIPICAQRMSDFSFPIDTSQFSVCIHAPGKIPYTCDFSHKISKSPKDSTTKTKMIMEGRTWRYYTNINNRMHPNRDIYLDLSFLGSTMIDGQKYLNCYVWKTEDGFSEEKAALITPQIIRLQIGSLLQNVRNLIA